MILSIHKFTPPIQTRTVIAEEETVVSLSGVKKEASAQVAEILESGAKNVRVEANPNRMSFPHLWMKLDESESVQVVVDIPFKKLSDGLDYLMKVVPADSQKNGLDEHEFYSRIELVKEFDGIRKREYLFTSDTIDELIQYAHPGTVACSCVEILG